MGLAILDKIFRTIGDFFNINGFKSGFLKPFFNTLISILPKEVRDLLEIIFSIAIGFLGLLIGLMAWILDIIFNLQDFIINYIAPLIILLIVFTEALICAYAYYKNKEKPIYIFFTIITLNITISTYLGLAISYIALFIYRVSVSVITAIADLLPTT